MVHAGLRVDEMRREVLAEEEAVASDSKAHLENSSRRLHTKPRACQVERAKKSSFSSS
jgi:hypothetical protein